MASFPSLRSDLLSREHAFPSNHIRPYSGVVRRCNYYTYNCQFRRSWTKLSPFRRDLLKIAPSVKLRRLSEFFRAESGKFSARASSTKEIGELLAQDHSVLPASDTTTELQSIVICLSLQTRNIVLNGVTSLHCSLLRCGSVLADFFCSPLFLYLKVIDRSPLLNLAKIYGRILLFGLIFTALDLTSGRMSSRHALAVPPATSTESQKRPQVEKARQSRRDRQMFRETTDKYEERLSGPSDRESGSAFFDQQIEAISRAGKKQLEAHLELLKQEASVLEIEVDGAVREFLDTQAELERMRDDVLKSEKEESLKEKADTIVNVRRRLLEIVASLTKISQRMEQLGSSRHANVDQDAVSLQSKIATDLEQLKSTLREQSLLPQAAKIEPEIEGGLAEIQEDKIILEQMELEQIISQKLSDVLEKLVARLDESNDEDETDLEQRMSELRDLILTDARWRDGDIELRNDIIHNRDSIKPLSPKEQEDILVTRDRLLNSTWYDERKKRWEMDPSAALLAVQKKLAGRARIRHDRCVMYLSLKGDEREYVVNTKAFNAEYEDYGGFQSLYLKLLASGVPTSVEVMWIPLAELPTERLLQLPFKMIWWLLEDLWNSNLVVSVRPWYYKTGLGAVEEVMIRFGFPTIQRIVPQKIRVLLGFELAEGAEAAEPTDIIIWQQEAQKHVDARYAEGSGSYPWWISLPVRSYVVGLPLLIVLRYVVGIFIAPFRPQRLAMNEREWKEKKQEELIKKLDLQPKKQTIDPIRNIFDNMKRVRRPEVSLKDFAGIDIIKEEISEIISFLKNPKLFREMGARPPRGVLIVGESGTGKTTLALAIAAEARVPMVEVQGSELEGGAWVGQGASNVRELFKTAREMAPLIIFMDDFDHFAGVRGATSDTRKQDHESLINQLLVELDGFETQEGVVLVATTSRPFAIDEALRRPGRMDRTIQLPMPNKQEREQILRQAARRTMDADLVDYVDWGKVAEKTAGLTPARLKYVPEGLEGSAVSFKIADEEELFFIFEWLAKLNKASPKWLKESKFTKRYNDMLIDWLGLRVTKEDLEDAVEYLDVFGQSKPGIELYDPPYVWTKEFKFPHAVWAAGKGLIALLLPDFDEVDIIWLDPTSWEGIAFTKLTKKLEGGYQETGTRTRSYFEKELVSYFGSYVASRMLLPFGENNSLCKFELQSAQEVATRMVMEYGWASDDSPMIYITDGSATTTAMGDKHEAEVADKINQLFTRAYDKASQILEQNRPVLEAMLEHLLEYDVINREDLTRILNDKGAVFEEGPFSLLPFTHTEIVGITTNGSGRSGKESPMSAVA